MFCECTHIKTNGIKCHSPAMRGTSLCYYHARVRRRAPALKTPKDLPFDLPDLIEPGMLEIALHEVLNALASGRISPRRAGVLLHGLQLADKKLSERPFNFDAAPSFQPTPPSLAHRDDQEPASEVPALAPACAPLPQANQFPQVKAGKSALRLRVKKPPAEPGAFGGCA